MVLTTLAIVAIYVIGVAFLVRREIKQQEKIEKKIIHGRITAARIVRARREK